MLFKQVLAEGLAQYSYIVGAPKVRKMVVIDPKRDIDDYLEFSHRHRLNITDVLETHLHADHVSGGRALAQETGATLWMPGYDLQETYEIDFPHEKIREDDKIQVGTIQIRALHTPGPTPEHLSYMIYDSTQSAKEPLMMFSGDFLLIGDLGIPEVEEAAKRQKLAEQWYDSLSEKLKGLPGKMKIYPGHGMTTIYQTEDNIRFSSSLSRERRSNPFLKRSVTKEKFLEKLFAKEEIPPSFHRRVRELNARGPAILEYLPGLEPIKVSKFRKMADNDHVVIDLRGQLNFGMSHITGALGLGARAGLPSWALQVLPPDKPILLVGSDEETVESAVRKLIRVGYDNIRGYLKGGMKRWLKAGYPVQRLPQISPEELQSQIKGDEELKIIDVRAKEDWEAGHIEGAIHLASEKIDQELEQLPRDDQKLAVISDNGYQSTVVSSVLQRHGFEDVVNVVGGINNWEASGLKLVQPTAS